jgi:hypothetical protein
MSWNAWRSTSDHGREMVVVFIDPILNGKYQVFTAIDQQIDRHSDG